MMALIIGDSGSGKSEYAENLLVQMAGTKEKYYIATMRICDKQSEERAERHRRKRRGKGFITIEQARNIGLLADKIPENAAVILECIANLTANELFDDGTMPAERAVDKVVEDVHLLQKKRKALVVVTCRYSDTDEEYDEETKEYIRTLLAINERIAKLADCVVEVTAGIPTVTKGQAMPMED